jgi:pyrroline-5-carboxylate reductase
MPKTPAMVGEGMTVLCAAPTLPASAKKNALDLMGAVGKSEWLPDETLMDAVTAISGCGPAYVFLFIESLVKAGMDVGLSEELAKTLSCQTILGSLTLAERSGKTFEQLRIQVTSPGGATEAALKVLMQSNEMQLLIEKAIECATTRSKQLADNS